MVFLAAPAGWSGVSPDAAPQKNANVISGPRPPKMTQRVKECAECIVGGVGAFFDFRIIWKEDDRRDAHARAECDAMRDQVPPINMVIAMEMLHVRPTSMGHFDTS